MPSDLAGPLHVSVWRAEPFAENEVRAIRPGGASLVPIDHGVGELNREPARGAATRPSPRPGQYAVVAS